MGFGGGGGGGGGAPVGATYLVKSADATLTAEIVVSPPDRVGLGVDPLSWMSATSDVGMVAVNDAILVQFYVPMEMTVDRILFEAVTVDAANRYDVGIYNSSGTKIVSKGASTAAPAAGLNTVTITATTLSPGWYWLAISSSQDTATTFKQSFSTFRPVDAWATIKRKTAAHPLPASITISTTTNDNRAFVLQAIRQGVTL